MRRFKYGKGAWHHLILVLFALISSISLETLAADSADPSSKPATTETNSNSEAANPSTDASSDASSDANSVEPKKTDGPQAQTTNSNEVNPEEAKKTQAEKPKDNQVSDAKEGASKDNQRTGQSKEQVSSAESTKAFVGLDLGLSTSFLFSDAKTGAFGAGLGSHFGLSGSLMVPKRVGVKIRLERTSFSQQLMGNKETNDLLAGSLIKAMEQNYWALSAGAEWRSPGYFGRQFFLEALLGYAIGQPSQITFLIRQLQDELHHGNLNPENLIFLSLGWGFRREFRKKWNATFSIRSWLMTKSVYGEPFQQEKYFPLPFLFSAGLERGF